MTDDHPIRQTCVLMGLEFNGTARFIWDAEEWLARRTDSLDITCIHVERNLCVWRVSGDGWHGEAHTLPLALAAAVQSHHAARCAAVRPGDCGCSA